MLIVIALGNFPDQDIARSRYTMKFMIQVRVDRDRLSRLQQDRRSCRHHVSPSIRLHFHILVRQASLAVIQKDFDLQITTPAIDDILGLIVMVMHRRIHIIPHVDILLCIYLRVLWIVLIPIPKGNQRKPALVEVSEAEIRDIPSKHVVTDLIVLMILAFPVLRCKAAEGWQKTSVLLQHPFHLFYDRIDFRSLHTLSSPSDSRIQKLYGCKSFSSTPSPRSRHHGNKHSHLLLLRRAHGQHPLQILPRTCRN